MLGCSPRGRPVPSASSSSLPTTIRECREAVQMRWALEPLGIMSLTVPTQALTQLGASGGTGRISSLRWEVTWVPAPDMCPPLSLFPPRATAG